MLSHTVATEYRAQSSLINDGEDISLSSILRPLLLLTR